ncbi:MAG: hypothetical protein FGF52_00985 [Candidatus Brockarchaeota archaeon]|nr:hypothetical protein [Candidatus Brockarchaeota archaeon]
MDERLVWTVIVAILLIVPLEKAVCQREYAQAEYNTFPRGILGDVLDTTRLHGLVENLYTFRNRVTHRGGLDYEFLQWLLPRYREFSRAVLGSPLWPLKLVLLPAAIIISSCLPLYPQTGLLGVVFVSGFLTGMVYALPLFLIIEVFSKVGLTAMHGKTMLKILLVLFIISALILLIAHGYPNAPLLFSAYAILTATLWFTWFLPILLYYWR